MSLSEVLPDEVWLTELAWEPDQAFRLEGLVVHNDGAEMGKVSRLLDSLKSKVGAGAGFKEIKLESVQSSQDGEIELVKFLISASKQ